MKYAVPLYTVQLVRAAEIPWAENRARVAPRDVCEIVKSVLGDPDRECVLLLFLDSASQLLGVHHLSTGSMGRAEMSGREVFRAALLAGADAVVLAHNHVSGIPEPSDIDERTTVVLEQLGALIGVKVLDHVIVGHQRYFSFREEGRMAAPDDLWSDGPDHVE